MHSTMNRTRPWLLAILACALLLSGCDGSHPTPISRPKITAAFSTVEPLALERDVTATNSDSSLDSVYVPASSIVNPPLRVALFDNEAAAKARALALREAENVDFIQYKNAILTFRADVAGAKRARLTTVLTSL